jgi:hypothetical protein
VSEIANTNLLLEALRKVGVDVPDALPKTLRGTSYWHVVCGAFDTMVDKRDAETQDDAIVEAVSPLQPWYVRNINLDETPTVVQASRNEYIDWLKRGVK